MDHRSDPEHTTHAGRLVVRVDTRRRDDEHGARRKLELEIERVDLVTTIAIQEAIARQLAIDLLQLNDVGPVLEDPGAPLGLAMEGVTEQFGRVVERELAGGEVGDDVPPIGWRSVQDLLQFRSAAEEFVRGWSLKRLGLQPIGRCEPRSSEGEVLLQLLPLVHGGTDVRLRAESVHVGR